MVDLKIIQREIKFLKRVLGQVKDQLEKKENHLREEIRKINQRYKKK